MDKKYGKLVYGRVKKIFKNLLEDHQNSEPEEDVEEFTDSEDENQDIFGWEDLPDIFQNVTEFDAVQDSAQNVYDGEFKNGLRHGRGVQVIKNQFL